MPQKKINVAIVGLGFGAEFIPIYQRHPHANMYAICQRTPEKLKADGDASDRQALPTKIEALNKDPALTPGSPWLQPTIVKLYHRPAR
jgi:predicted dehydrogenase